MPEPGAPATWGPAAAGHASTGQFPAAGDARQRVLDQIEIWRKELINLARSNRLLYFRHTKASTLEIVREPDRIAEVVGRLLAGHAWRFYMPPLASPRSDDVELAGEGVDPELADMLPGLPSPDELITNRSDAKSLRNALRLLERRATQEFMDKGIWILYLAAGVLRWRDPDDEEDAESPLLLVPVELRRESVHEAYELRRVDEDIVINPALALRLADFGLELPMIDQDELVVDGLFDEVEELIAGRDGWQVQRRLLISPFSFHKEVMYRDLLQNADTIASDLAVQALALGAEAGSTLDFDPIPEERLDIDAPPEDVMTILDADATQRQCIAAAASGRSFVMDGPPGTGKSQTIANVIAELLAAGRTVLFVSEKAAALEVVQKRLHQAGLGDYTLELHSHKATRKEVAQQLGAALKYHPTPPPAMGATAISQLRQRRHALSERARAVNETRTPLGRSLHQVVGRIAELQGLPQAPPPTIGSRLSSETLALILATVGELSRAWGPVTRGENFLWRGFKSDGVNAARAQQISEQLDSAVLSLRAVRSTAADIAEALLQPAPRDIDEAERLLQLAHHVDARHPVPPHWLTDESLAAVSTLIELRTHQSTTSAAYVEYLTETVGVRWRDLDPGAIRPFAQARDRLARLPSSGELPPGLSVAELRDLLGFVRSSATVLREASDDAQAIAGALGFSPSAISVRRAIELAELGLCATEPVKPEASWINPARIDEVERAIETLKILCHRYREHQNELAGVFTERVLDLDLQTLCHRFTSVHTGVAKLGSAYRQDKKQVAETTRAGRATKDAIRLLPRALEWQNLTRQLDAAERQHAGILGEHSYQRVETDFDLVHRAAATARRMLDLAGRTMSSSGLSRQLARDGVPSPEVVPAARRLCETLPAWLEHSRATFAQFADHVIEADLVS